MSIRAAFRALWSSSGSKGEIAPQSPSPLSRWLPQDLALTRDQMLTVSSVFACVRIIAEHVASSPVRVFARDARGSRTFYSDDPVARLLNLRPHPDITAQGFREALIVQALTYGGSYAVIEWDRAQRVRSLRPLLSRDVQVVRDPVSGGLAYQVQTTAGLYTLQAEDVIHVRGLTIEGLLGASILSVAARAIATGYAAESFGIDYFANGAIPAGVLTSSESLTAENRKRLTEEWQAAHGGRSKQGTAVLPKGMKYESIATTGKDAQLIESRIFSKEEIAGFFGVPLVLLGVAAAAQGYGTNVAQLGLQFARAGLTPWCRRIEQEITYKLFAAWGGDRQVDHDLSWITQGSWLEQSQAVQTQIAAGVCTIDEGRELLGRDPLQQREPLQGGVAWE